MGALGGSWRGHAVLCISWPCRHTCSSASISHGLPFPFDSWCLPFGVAFRLFLKHVWHEQICSVSSTTMEHNHHWEPAASPFPSGLNPSFHFFPDMSPDRACGGEQTQGSFQPLGCVSFLPASEVRALETENPGRIHLFSSHSSSSTAALLEGKDNQGPGLSGWWEEGLEERVAERFCEDNGVLVSWHSLFSYF